MNTIEIYQQMAVKIIAVQEAIIGPLAIDQASTVANMTIDWDNKSVVITGNGKQVISDLISSYQELFGLSSLEVSKDAVVNLSHMLQPEEVPELLMSLR